MYDLEAVQVHDCLDDEPKQEGSLLLAKPLLPAHVLIQILPIYILADDVDGPFGHDGLVLLDETGRLEYLHDLRLVPVLGKGYSMVLIYLGDSWSSCRIFNAYYLLLLALRQHRYTTENLPVPMDSMISYLFWM